MQPSFKGAKDVTINKDITKFRVYLQDVIDNILYDRRSPRAAELIKKLNSAYVFHVSFENGTRALCKTMLQLKLDVVCTFNYTKTFHYETFCVFYLKLIS